MVIYGFLLWMLLALTIPAILKIFLLILFVVVILMIVIAEQAIYNMLRKDTSVWKNVRS